MHTIKSEILFAITYLFFFSLIAACSAGVSSERKNEVVFFNIIDNINSADITDPDFKDKYREILNYPKVYKNPWGRENPRILKAGFEIDKKKMFQNLRRSLYLSSRKGIPCRISIPLNKLELINCNMTFALGGYHLNKKERERHLIIELADEDEKYKLFDSKDIENPVLEKAWKEFSLKLPYSDFPGKRLNIEFESSSPETEHILMANPLIFKDTDSGRKTPNVLFVCIDAMRADAVNSVVNRYSLTPVMDSVAEEGAVFKNHFVVANWTRPSTIAMLSSNYASATGVNIFYPTVHDEEKRYFYRKSGVKLITTLLRKKGYLTRSIGNNPFIIDYTGIGVDLDFDELSEYSTKVRDTVDITDEALTWIRANSNKNFFLFVNYIAPHNSYIPPSKYLNELKKRLKGIHPWFRAYLGEVAYTDDYLGRLLDGFKKINLYDNTIIIITTDHGEIFTEAHGMSPYTDVESIFTHGQTQFDEELKVPLIIKPPSNVLFKNKIINSQVRNIDIAPTILDLLGETPPEAFQGWSLLPVIDGSENKERKVYSEGRKMYSVRAEGYKYAERFNGFGIRPEHWGGPTVKEFWELYDIKKDPDELNNIYYTRPDIAKKMKRLLTGLRFKQPENIIFAKNRNAKGRIKTIEGFFYDIKTTGTKSSIKRVNRKEFIFHLAKGEKLIYQTIPKYAPVLIETNESEQLLCGKFLLPLYDKIIPGGRLIKPSESQSMGRPSDTMLSLVQSGMLYWNVPIKGGISRVKKEKYIARDINRLLKNWGYIQGKEKKDNPDKKIINKPEAN